MRLKYVNVLGASACLEDQLSNILLLRILTLGRGLTYFMFFDLIQDIFMGRAVAQW